MRRGVMASARWAQVPLTMTLAHPAQSLQITPNPITFDMPILAGTRSVIVSVGITGRSLLLSATLGGAPLTRDSAVTSIRSVYTHSMNVGDYSNDTALPLTLTWDRTEVTNLMVAGFCYPNPLTCVASAKWGPHGYAGPYLYEAPGANILVCTHTNDGGTWTYSPSPIPALPDKPTVIISRDGNPISISQVSTRGTSNAFAAYQQI